MANLPPWLESLRGELEHIKPTALRARIQRLWAPDDVTLLTKQRAGGAASAAPDDEEANKDKDKDKEGGALTRALKELQDKDWTEKRRRLLVYAQIGTEDQPCWLFGTCTGPGPLAVKQWQAVPLKQLGAFHRAGSLSASSYATLSPPPADLTAETALQLIDPRHVLAHYRRSHPSTPAAAPMPTVDHAAEADPLTLPPPPITTPTSTPTPSIAVTAGAVASTSTPTSPVKKSAPNVAAAAAVPAVKSKRSRETPEQQRRIAAAWAEVARHGLPPGVFAQDNPPPGLAAAATPPLLLAKGEAAARPLTDVLPVPTNSLWPLPRNMPVLDYETLWALMDTQASTVPWPTLPIAQAFWLALRPAASGVMGLLRWSEASGHTTWASDAVDALLDEWEHSALGQAENKRAALEFYMATQTLHFLAGCKSLVFRAGRGLILAATLAERVLRYTYVGASAVQGTTLRCALTGEPIAPGSAYHAWDVQWRPDEAGGGYGPGRVLTVVVAAECSAWPLNEPMMDVESTPPAAADYAIVAPDHSDQQTNEKKKRKKEKKEKKEKEQETDTTATTTSKKKKKKEPAADAPDAAEVVKRPKKRKRDVPVVVNADEPGVVDAEPPAKKPKTSTSKSTDKDKVKVREKESWPDVPEFHGQHPDLALEGLVLRGGRNVDAWVRAKACYEQHAAALTPELAGLMRDAAACGTREELDAWTKTSVSQKTSNIVFKVVSLLAMALWVPAPGHEEKDAEVEVDEEEDIMAMFDRIEPVTIALNPAVRLRCRSLVQIVAARLGTTLTLDMCFERHPDMVAAAWLALAPDPAAQASQQ